jgi:hypothetical protein
VGDVGVALEVVAGEQTLTGCQHSGCGTRWKCSTACLAGVTATFCAIIYDGLCIAPEGKLKAGCVRQKGAAVAAEVGDVGVALEVVAGEPNHQRSGCGTHPKRLLGSVPQQVLHDYVLYDTTAHDE